MSGPPNQFRNVNPSAVVSRPKPGQGVHVQMETFTRQDEDHAAYYVNPSALEAKRKPADSTESDKEMDLESQKGAAL